ncbi:ATP-dependent DNA helicase [Trichodelitschia bisporula]|uniref:ATP-dependent DNA helicase n=1 Tax=Trichodelitschia bisporula TaxID=703511 RepID=A0A6G1HTQ1_9PEZI|nr:ATP-dependent DNA helicase [Trichodelitschia bisporula]
MPVPKKIRHFDIEFTLRKVFGKTEFRPLQRDVITAALNGDDIFLQAATSFGKSLCFQLPAVVDFGITIVISPLLALMNNQIASLRAANIKVESLNGNTPRNDRKDIMADLQCGHPKTRLLYVTPEQCALDHFRRVLRIIYEQRELARIAIDEAHCISEWGHDFRPAFQQLSFFKKEFPDVPLICCTATATSVVRNDIISMLGLDASRLKLFLTTTSRPNLHFEVRFKQDEKDHYDNFVTWLKGVHARRAGPTRKAQLNAVGKRENISGIIYTLYRKDCEALASRLREDGIGAKPYHAGLAAEEKDENMKRWVEGLQGYDVIVATTAFGMGIDKKDVRFVVHWQIPKSFEGFYQEAGRAGRDGKASACILYYGREDRDRAAMMLSRDNARKESNRPGAAALSNMESRTKSLQALITYCETTNKCRHQLINEYFGDTATPACDFACDWHKDPVKLARDKENGLASEEWTFSVNKSDLALALNTDLANDYWMNITRDRNNGLISAPSAWAVELGLPTSKQRTADGETVLQVDMFHQLHCLERIRMDIISAPFMYQLNPNRTDQHPWTRHTLHCVDYLRQAVMCNGDVTLVSTGKDLEFDHSPPRQCRDFEAISKWVLDHKWEYERYTNIVTLGGHSSRQAG